MSNIVCLRGGQHQLVNNMVGHPHGSIVGAIELTDIHRRIPSGYELTGYDGDLSDDEAESADEQVYGSWESDYGSNKSCDVSSDDLSTTELSSDVSGDSGLDVSIEDYMNPTLLVMTGTSSVYQFLHISERFHQTCQQVRSLDMKCNDLELRYHRYRSYKPLQYTIRLQLSVTEGVLEMYEYYAMSKLYQLLNLYFKLKGSNLLNTVDYQQIDYQEIDILHVDTYLQEVMEDLDLEQDDSDSDLELIGVVDGDEDQKEYYV